MVSIVPSVRHEMVLTILLLLFSTILKLFSILHRLILVCQRSIRRYFKKKPLCNLQKGHSPKYLFYTYTITLFCTNKLLQHIHIIHGIKDFFMSEEYIFISKCDFCHIKSYRKCKGIFHNSKPFFVFFLSSLNKLKF
jgi:hypothetical protein